jgi:membrane protein
MNSSIQFAALAVLCLVPFLVIVSAAAGGDARRTFITRLGLDQHAAQDVNSLVSPGRHAVSTLTVFGAAFVLLGAIGIASTLQVWYQTVYDQPPGGWSRQLVSRLLWLGGFVAYLTLQELVGTELAGIGARAPIYLVTFVVALGFYWWTLHVLLIGRARWRQLFPGALATAFCVTGLGLFSSLLFSGEIVSSQRNYGAIGVVMVLLSYLIGLGVCLHLGAMIRSNLERASSIAGRRPVMRPPSGHVVWLRLGAGERSVDRVFDGRGTQLSLGSSERFFV